MEKTLEAKETLNVGDILCATWGYDAVNVDFYKVIKATDKTVTVAPLLTETVKSEGFHGEWVRPIEDEIVPLVEYRRKVKHSPSGNPFVEVVGNYHRAYKWNGEDVHTYNYH